MPASSSACGIPLWRDTRRAVGRLQRMDTAPDGICVLFFNDLATTRVPSHSWFSSDALAARTAAILLLNSCSRLGILLVRVEVH